MKKAPLFFWAATGPLCVTCALSALTLSAALPVWPFVMLSLLGLGCTWLWHFKGLSFSLLALGGLVLNQYELVFHSLFCPLFLISIALSWGIVCLGRREILSWQHGLEEEHQGACLSLQEVQHALHQAQEESVRLREEVQVKEQESDNWYERCEVLTQERENLQRALEEEYAQLRALAVAPRVVNPILPQERLEEQTTEDFRYRQLKEQYAEKAQLLQEARKMLFDTETRLYVLQKEKQESEVQHYAEELRLQAHLQEHCDLEMQVATLEQIISELLILKKTTRPRKVKIVSQASLPTVLQEAMDQKQASQQLTLPLLLP